MDLTGRVEENSNISLTDGYLSHYASTFQFKYHILKLKILALTIFEQTFRKTLFYIKSFLRLFTNYIDSQRFKHKKT